jgi:hypothetical protein
VPERLVTSAKSWLSNPHIDPKQRILPWRSEITEQKLSPLECSRRYLQRTSGTHSCTRVGRRFRPSWMMTGWQAHSVRGFLAGVVRKKLGRTLRAWNTGAGWFSRVRKTLRRDRLRG